MWPRVDRCQQNTPVNTLKITTSGKIFFIANLETISAIVSQFKVHTHLLHSIKSYVNAKFEHISHCVGT